MTYPVVITPLAEAWAKAHSSVETLISMARIECNEFDDPTSPECLVFHTFEINDQLIICFPKDGALVVDTSSFPEERAITPNQNLPEEFRMNRVLIPQPDSDR